MSFYLMFWWLVVAHAVCDYPLQGDFLARGKNCRQPLSGVPWPICLLAHAVIHGAAVALITQSVCLGLLETAAHALIDFGKCAGGYDFTFDQCLHVLTKCVWCLIAVPLP